MSAQKNERVILVDERDRAIGAAGKLWVHKRASLHRAFSIFVLNSRDELLLQRRAMSKYLSPGLWTNTCCGHPRPGEATEAAARRRLNEEMGLDCDLSYLFGFRYRAEVGDGLVEHEYDHVFIGKHDTDPRPDPSEVGDWRWQSLRTLREDLAMFPERFTRWFAPALHGLSDRMCLTEDRGTNHIAVLQATSATGTLCSDRRSLQPEKRIDANPRVD